MASKRSITEALDKLAVAVEMLDLEELGSGAYGSVHSVTVNGKECVAKKVHNIIAKQASGEDSWQMTKFKEECVTLSRLKYPSLVEFIGIHYGANRDDISLIMERLHTDLATFAEKNPNTNISVKLNILRDISEGLVYLHSLDPPLIHRDLTAPNILLTKDLRAKIGDFGVSRYQDLSSDVKLTNIPGNPSYMPPEASLEVPIYSTKLDVFSFGSIILHISIGRVPTAFPITLGKQFLHGIRGRCELRRRQRDVEAMGREHCLYVLMVECLHDNPDHRPTAHLLKNKLSQIQQQHQQQNKRLLKASKAGDLVAVKDCLPKGADKEHTDQEHGRTPLIWASRKGHVEVVSHLIDTGANIHAQDKDGRSSVWIASFYGHMRDVKLLLTAGASVDLADNEGHLPTVELLLAAGADLHHCNNDGSTAAYFASMKGHLNVLKKLVASGALVDVQTNIDGRTLLWTACRNSHLHTVKYLTSVGATVNMATKTGETPLWTASFNGHTDIVEHLLSLEAATDLAKNGGFTPLHVACQNGHLSVVESLLKNRASLNALTNDKMTPLMWAAYEGHTSIVRLLLLKTDCSIKHKSGKTAFELAKQQGHEDICRLLS